MQAVVSQKGQVTLPIFLRKIFNIKPQDEVVFQATKEGILVKKTSLLTESLFGVVSRNKKIQFTPLDQVRKQVGQKLGERYSV